MRRYRRYFFGIAAVIHDIMERVAWLNRATGGWVEVLAHVAIGLTTVLSLYVMVSGTLRVINMLMSMMLGMNVWGAVSKAVTAALAGLHAMIVAQIGLNAATVFYLTLTGVGLVAVAAAAIAAAAYYDSAKRGAIDAANARKEEEKYLESIIDLYRELNDASADMADRVNQVRDRFKTPEDEYQAQIEWLDKAIGMRSELNQRWSKIEKDLFSTHDPKKVNELLDEIERIKDQLESLEDVTASEAVRMQGLFAQDLIKNMGLEKWFEEPLSEMEKLNAAQDRVEWLYSKGIIRADEYQTAIDNLTLAQEELARKTLEATRNGKRLSESSIR